MIEGAFMKKIKKVLCSEFDKLIDVVLNKFNDLNNLNDALKNNKINLNLELKIDDLNEINCQIKANLCNEKSIYKLVDVCITENNGSTTIERNNYLQPFFSKFNMSDEYMLNSINYGLLNLGIDNKNFNSDYKNSSNLNSFVNFKKNRVLPKDIYITPEHRSRMVHNLKSKFDISYLKIFEYRYSEDLSNRLDVNLICDKVNLSPPGVYRKLYRIARLYDETK